MDFHSEGSLRIDGENFLRILIVHLVTLTEILNTFQWLVFMQILVLFSVSPVWI